jgi:drug/metabolite transporter (DMT)-like permease
MIVDETVAVKGLDPSILGETAAVVTSCFSTACSLLFTSAGKRIGSLSVNAYRTVMAVGLLILAHAILMGTILPSASNAQWFWMGVSGIIGLGVGDSGLYAAYVMIGPRRSVLVMSLSPIFASMGAYLMLGEVMPELAIFGIAMTMAGVVVVMLEEEERAEVPLSKKLKWYGLFSALIGAACQGVGLVFSKKGIGLNPSTTLNPLSAALMRLILGALSVWIVLLLAGKLPELREAVRSKEGISHTAAGAFLGPFLAVTFSMIAVTYTQTGVAQTLMSLTPILIIPAIWIRYKQRTSWRGILGAGIAVIGVSILFLI